MYSEEEGERNVDDEGREKMRICMNGVENKKRNMRDEENVK